MGGSPNDHSSINTGFGLHTLHSFGTSEALGMMNDSDASIHAEGLNREEGYAFIPSET
jgi:hypothetical protein